MFIKITLGLAVLVISFGLTNTAGISATIGGLKPSPGASENETGKNVELVLDNGSVVNCTFLTKKSAAQNLGNGRVAVSINSNWICQ